MSTPSARVMLVYPPSRTQSHYDCPAGILMLAAVLEEAGHEVHLVDANAAIRKSTTAQIVEQARQLKPDVIGMTLLTPLVQEAYRLAGDLRDCGAKLLAGGPHTTLLPEETLTHGFDAAVVGEGELTVVEAVEALLGCRPLETVLGLVYRDASGQIRRNAPRPLVADLDSLPLPARHLANPAHYGSTAKGSLFNQIFTSRGCPARCAYCAGGLFGKKFRFRSADSVVNEMVAVHREFGTRSFYFTDDAMSMDRKRMEQICQRLIDERHGFTWSMMTRIDSVDERLLELASRAGCVQIDYGVESGDPETLKRIHKPHTVEMVRRVVPLTRRHGIRPTVFFILGFPWEGVESLQNTLQLMRDISDHVSFAPAIGSVLIPFPNTEIYERYKDQHGFADWWLSDDRTFDVPRIGSHPYYQSLIFRVGAVLDADFFHYPSEVKAKILDIFRFMWASNLRDYSRWGRAARLSAFDLSRKLDAVSPTLERSVFLAARLALSAYRKLEGLPRRLRRTLTGNTVETAGNEGHGRYQEPLRCRRASATPASEAAENPPFARGSHPLTDSPESTRTPATGYRTAPVPLTKADEEAWSAGRVDVPSSRG